VDLINSNKTPAGGVVTQTTSHVIAQNVRSDLPRKLLKSVAILTSSSQLTVSKPTTNVLLEDCTNVVTATNGDVKLFVTKRHPLNLWSLVFNLQINQVMKLHPWVKTLSSLACQLLPTLLVHSRNVTSSGPLSSLPVKKLPLPLDSCCSVSLVSLSHADLVASKCPKLKYQSLEKPDCCIRCGFTLSVESHWLNGNSNPMEQWKRKHLSNALSWPVIFGENH